MLLEFECLNEPGGGRLNCGLSALDVEVQTRAPTPSLDWILLKLQE